MTNIFLCVKYLLINDGDFMAKKKNKLKNLGLEELFWRLKAQRVSNNTFWIEVKVYLYSRIKAKNYLSDFEIELLNRDIGEMKYDGRIPIRLRDDVSRYATRLIVMSKNTDKPDFVDKVARNDIDCINSFKPEDINIFFETALKYALDCVNREYIKLMLNSLVCDVNFLQHVRNSLKEEAHLDAIDRKINSLKQKCNLSEVFPIEVPNIIVEPISEKLPLIEGKNILTVDKPGTRILDSAFSIEKKDNLYFFNVYVSDVPSFLIHNEELLKYAYEMGTAMYNFQQQNDVYKVNMIPYDLAKMHLSLSKNDIRNVITFSFCVDDKGSIQLINVSRNRAVINDNITTHAIRGFEFNNINTDRDVSICKEMCKLVSNNASSLDYKLSARKRIGDIVAFPSIITNYHVGRNSNFAIYREDGKFVKTSEDKYAYSVTPLRKFVSDINLALYLNQLGLINCPDKYIHYLEDNIDSILEYLNRREALCEYFGTNYREVKKYYKK